MTWRFLKVKVVTILQTVMMCLVWVFLQVTSSGQPFWSGPKRCPHPVEFDPCEVSWWEICELASITFPISLLLLLLLHTRAKQDSAIVTQGHVCHGCHAVTRLASSNFLYQQAQLKIKPLSSLSGKSKVIFVVL